MIVTRFAPSPNGPLHMGHAWAAIVAHDLARNRSGRFLLRIEDIDGPRSRSELVAEYQADLAWLGLSWDGPVLFQSQRFASYTAAGDRLKAMGLLYPCSCTRAEIAANAQAIGPDGPLYPGTCRHRGPVTTSEVAWRIDIAKAAAAVDDLTWEDALAGTQRARPELLGDVVLLRKEAPASYHLAATVDDAADGITLVSRGADLFAATHVHRLLQALLGLPVPVWHHHALLVDDDGRKLAKRRNAPSLGDRRRAGDDGLELAKSLRAGHLPAGISSSQSLSGVP